MTMATMVRAASGGVVQRRDRPWRARSLRMSQARCRAVQPPSQVLAWTVPRRPVLAVGVRTALSAEQGFQHRHVDPGPAPADPRTAR
jgi:hypothetical protein